MTNITELRQELLNTLKDLRSGKIKPSVAVEMNNAAGKAIQTINAELKYAQLRQEKPSIEFMKTSEI